MKEDAPIQFKLLLPAGLKARLDAQARANRRSLSQEIIFILEHALPATGERLRKTYALVDLAELVSEIEGEDGDRLRNLVSKRLEEEQSELEKLMSQYLRHSA